jgi:hypothetical protein
MLKELARMQEEVARLSFDVTHIYESLLEHKTSFRHPYKTDKEMHIEQAKRYMQAYDDFLEENDLEDEDVI